MDFYRRMELVCQRIPYGRAATYGQIALLCRKLRNARQVGYVLSHRLMEGQIPAHRIVNSRWHYGNTLKAKGYRRNTYNMQGEICYAR